MSAETTSFLKRFKEEKSGNVAITFGMMALVMTGAIGAAVDIGRALHAQSKLQTAADAASTAAAGLAGVTDAQRVAAAKKFFEQNNGGSFGDAPDVRVDITANGNNVKITVEGDVPTALTRVLGVDSIPINAKSEAGTSGRMVEIGMMIDVTGSMSSTRGGMKKIDALKLAADDLLDILFPGGYTTSGQVKVAIAPMADYVNVGQYASQVTGWAERGAYANLTNLASTKNGPFSGNYSGYWGNSQPLGSQHGATPVNNSVLPGQVAGATPGQTYASAHCTAPGQLGGGGGGASPLTYGSPARPMGYWINDSSSNPPDELMSGAVTGGFYMINKYDEIDGRWELDTSLPTYRSTGYFIPIPADPAGVQYERRNGPYYNDTHDIGVPIEVRHAPGVTRPAQIKYGRYWRVTGWSSTSGYQYYNWSNASEGYYLPIPQTGMIGGGGAVDPDCTGTNAAPDQTAGYLISCVTDRTGSNAYTDEPPGPGSYIGVYNQVAPGRTTNKLNYSEDGRCYTSGRELPAIIPLTNDRTKLDAFFNAATPAGATPGHLGHAWAWYMLSPKWNSIWSMSSAAPYNDPIVKKYAVIMTDGEYNTQYSGTNSATQALNICNGMKAQGIHVITIGFGFGSDPEGTAAGNMLQSCASDASSFYWPYNSDDLRDTFRSIGAKITSETVNLVVMQ